MRKTSILLAALLALSLLMIMPGALTLEPISTFMLPAFSSTGFSQLSTGDIGQTPIIFSPSEGLLLNGGGLGSYFMPRLETGDWSSSMRTSSVNQMFAVLSHGIGDMSVP